MKRLVLILALTLAGCDGDQHDGADGYRLDPKSCPAPVLAFDTKIVLAANVAELTRTAPAGVLVDSSDKSPAWALQIRRKGRPLLCEIHVIDPRVVYGPEFKGHELTHCICGQWHS